MKGIHRALLVLVLSASFADAEPPPGYYAPATGLTGGSLKQALHNIVSGHQVIPYGSLPGPLSVIWRDPANPANIILTYSRSSVPANSSWNREHLWPRSRGNSEQLGPDDSDLFHVVPTDLTVNAERGNLYFDASDPGDPGYRIPAHSLAPQTSRDSDSWQPHPAERGDIARALFYMDVRYDGQESQTSDFDLVSFPPMGAQMASLNTLLLWHLEDPPDAAERLRNDLIFSSYQGNRNPFIDHPNWATDIWGQPTSGGGGSRPLARVTAVAAAAVESPAVPAVFLVTLNQFARAGGLAVNFIVTGTATTADFTISGAGVTYDAVAKTGSILVPESFSGATLTLSATADGLGEPAETVVITLQAGGDYSVVPDASAVATATINDAPRLPASWNFDAAAPYPNPLLANSGTGSISFSGWRGTVASFAGSSGSALALVGNAGNASWIDFHLSMTGYADLTLSFWTRGTSNGFDSGTWSASTDGANFLPLSGVNTATRSSFFSQRTVSFASMPFLTDAPHVTLRYTLNGATSSSGNNRLDELVATATPVVSGGALRTVSLIAVDAIATEPTRDPAALALQMNGLATAAGLEIVLDFSGSTAALPGETGADCTISRLTSFDPQTRRGRVILAPGESAALLTITPVIDTLDEGGETIVATIVDSPDYLTGTSRTSTARIIEPVGNDNLANATLFTADSWTASANSLGATREASEPWHHETLQTGQRSVWWKWAAPDYGHIEVSTAGSNFDTLLAVYQGSSYGNLLRMGVNDDSQGGQTSRLIVPVTPSFTYSIAVDGYGQAAGDVRLSFRYFSAPTISVSVQNQVARERGRIPAVVRLTAAQAYPVDIPLRFWITGLAQLGVDYTAPGLEGSILKLPANQRTVDLLIIPAADTNPLEFSEQLSITLGNSTDYRVISGANTATVSIADDSPYTTAWWSSMGGITPADASVFGDPDGDGLCGLLEFIGNRRLRVVDGGSLLRLSRENFVDPADGRQKPFAAIRFVRRVDSAHLPVVIESCSSLEGGLWAATPVWVTTTTLGDPNLEELLYRSARPLTGNAALDREFFRLRATFP